MRNVLLCTLLAFAPCVTLLAADEPPTPKVTKLMVQGEDPEKDLDVNLFGSAPTQFVLVLSLPGQNILGIDEKGSKLTSAIDDKGTNLVGKKSDDWVSNFFSKIAKTRDAIAIPVKLGSRPAAGATAILLKGEIAIFCGSDEATETIQPFDIASGASAKFGENTLDIKPGKSGGFLGMGAAPSKPGAMVAVTLNGSGRWVKSMDFVDESGKTLKADERGSMSMNSQLTRDLNLEGAGKTVGVKVTYFKKVERVTRPIDLKIGVGLP